MQKSVDKREEYLAMVQKIQHAQLRRKTIIVDIDDVKRKCPVVSYLQLWNIIDFNYVVTQTVNSGDGSDVEDKESDPVCCSVIRLIQ